MKSAIENGVLTIYLEGRISSQNVHDLGKEIENILADCPGDKVVFEASALSYISSAGLRLLISLQKKVSNTITVCEVSPEVYETFDMTGFNKILDVRKKMREISLDGAVPIGRGRSSTAYRIDSEPIVKLYVDGVSLEKSGRSLILRKGLYRRYSHGHIL
ncbi:MAG: STAS domain-containing protein [Lachnospiraceae bacterium]|nr:STAS domain-containing protein [Lachnospiraceae bacterium]